MKYTALVKWNGNHYFSGDEVSGSKIETRPDETVWLWDDDDTDYGFPYYGEPENQWVEIDPETLKEN